jgi:hypothetical protein
MPSIHYNCTRLLSLGYYYDIIRQAVAVLLQAHHGGQPVLDIAIHVILTQRALIPIFGA